MDLKTFLSSPHYIGVRDLPNNPRPKYQKRLYIAKDMNSDTVKIGWSQGKRDLQSTARQRLANADWRFIWSWTLPSPSYVELRIKRQLNKFRLDLFQDLDVTSKYEQYVNIDERALIQFVRMNILTTLYNLEYIKYDKKLEALSQMLDVDSLEELWIGSMKYTSNYDMRKLRRNALEAYRPKKILDRKNRNTYVYYLVEYTREELLDTDVSSEEDLSDTDVGSEEDDDVVINEADYREDNVRYKGLFKVGTPIFKYWSGRETPENKMRGFVSSRTKFTDPTEPKTKKGKKQTIDGYVIKWWHNALYKDENGNEKVADINVRATDVKFDEEKAKSIERSKREASSEDSEYEEGKEDETETSETNSESILVWKIAQTIDSRFISEFMNSKQVILKGLERVKVVEWGDPVVIQYLDGTFDTISDNEIYDIVDSRRKINIQKLYDLMGIDMVYEEKKLDYEIYNYDETVDAELHEVKQIDGKWEVYMNVNGKVMELSKTSPFFKDIVDKHKPVETNRSQFETGTRAPIEGTYSNDLPLRRGGPPPGPPPDGVERVSPGRRGPGRRGPGRRGPGQPRPVQQSGPPTMERSQTLEQPPPRRQGMRRRSRLPPINEGEKTSDSKDSEENKYDSDDTVDGY